jgi:AraC-like DNA-binding protein
MYRTYDLFLAMGLGWALYGIINILTRKNKRDHDSILSLALTISLTIPILDHLIKPMPQGSHILYPLLLFTRNIYYCIGPLIWLYSRTLIIKKPITFKSVSLHAIPFICWVLLSMIFREFSFIRHGGDPGTGEFNYLSIIRITGLYLSLISYGLYSLVMINKHTKRFMDYYSTKNMGNTLSWLKGLIFFMTAIYSLLLFYEVYKFIDRIYLVKSSIQFLTLAPMIILFFFTFFSTKQHIPEDTKSGFKQEKYKKSSLNKNDIEKIYIHLETLIKTGKLYLNPDLTIEDIALEMNTTKHKISQVINMKTDKNFYHFINSYRVEEFQKSVCENRYPLYTIVDIAFQCGFNSSSVFYSMFKKIVNMTPKEYMRAVENESMTNL